MRSGISIVMTLAAAASGLQEPSSTGGGEAQKATPPPVSVAGAPDSGAPQLSADVGKAIAEIVGRMLAMPRYEEQIEVREGAAQSSDPVGNDGLSALRRRPLERRRKVEA